MALITNIETELKPYCTGTSLGIKINSIAPSIEYVERMFIKPELGKEQYLELVDAYDAGIDTATAALQALHKEVLLALAPLAAWHYAGAMVAQLTDAGQQETGGENSSGARLWVSNLQRQTFYDTGMQGIDNLLKFLDENKADYPLWVSGLGYAGLRKTILQTTDQFNEYVDIGGKRKTFMALRKTIRQVEFLTIRKAPGEDYYIELITGLTDNNLSDENAAIVDLLLPAIAHLTMGECKLNLQITDSGIFTISSSATDNGDKTMSAADIALVKQRQLDHAATGNQYLTNAIDYLNKTATNSVYATWYGSDLYADPTKSDYTNLPFNNGNLTSGFAL